MSSLELTQFLCFGGFLAIVAFVAIYVCAN